MADYEFISVRFTPAEIAFIREAFPNRATVEAIELAALAEAGRRMKEIADAEKLLRGYRSAEPAPAKTRPPGRKPQRPLPIAPKREREIETAAQALNAKVDAEAEARRARQRWADVGPDAFREVSEKRA
ncbi:MAG: hypothetical protein OXG99_07685 [Alphaproteobacteria bacterium]|nr:hypothetical protein [Alphaproteobacteria bacterium]